MSGMSAPRAVFSRALCTVLAVTAALTAACSGSGRGDPDPHGLALGKLTTIRDAVPAGARVQLNQAYESHWDRCGSNSSGAGFSDAAITIQFTSARAAAAIVASADTALHAAGWSSGALQSTPLGPFRTWTVDLPDGRTAHAQLSPGATDGGPVRWDLTGYAPPRVHPLPC